MKEFIFIVIIVHWLIHLKLVLFTLRKYFNNESNSE